MACARPIGSDWLLVNREAGRACGRRGRRDKGPVARGGQGWVYLAEDTHLGDLVAVKTLRDRYSADGAALADLERRTLVATRHPYIVQIRDFLPYGAPNRARTAPRTPNSRSGAATSSWRT